MFKKWIGAIFGIAVLTFSQMTCFAASPEAVNKAKATAIQITNADMSDEQKLLAIHDWICKNVYYDLAFSDVSYTLDGPMLYGKAVCGGYAEAFKAMSEACGIPCNIITGYVNNKGKWGLHGWNEVCLNGEYRYIDVTWDDVDKVDYILHDLFLTDCYIMDDIHDGMPVVIDEATGTVERVLPDNGEEDDEEYEEREYIEAVDKAEVTAKGITVSGYVYFDYRNCGGYRLRFDTPFTIGDVTLSYIEIGGINEEQLDKIPEYCDQHVIFTGDLHRNTGTTAKANYTFYIADRIG